MKKLRALFVLFSLVVLAAPAGAQRRGHDHDGEKRRGGVSGSDRRDDDGERDEHESRKVRDDDGDDGDDDERGSVLGNRRGNDDDDADDDNDDDDGDDEGGSRISRAGCTVNNGCDVTGRAMPNTLPEMINAVLVSRGQLTQSGRSWLGGGNFSPRFSRSASRAPTRVTWVDARRNLSQQWFDTNRDGRADIVRFYRAGRLIRTVRR